jgi:hypothetical protein
MFSLKIFKPKRNPKKRHVISIIGKVVKFLKIKEIDYNVYSDIENGHKVLYRVEFKKPIKMSTEDYDRLIYLLWKLNSEFKLAIIEGQRNEIDCDDCYDIKIHINREEVDGSIYVKNIRFEERL